MSRKRRFSQCLRCPSLGEHCSGFRGFRCFYEHMFDKALTAEAA